MIKFYIYKYAHWKFSKSQYYTNEIFTIYLNVRIICTHIYSGGFKVMRTMWSHRAAIFEGPQIYAGRFF